MAIYSAAYLGFVLFFLILHEIAGKYAPKHQWIVRLLAGLSFYLIIAKYRIIFILISTVTIWWGGKTLCKITAEGKAQRKQPGLSKEEKKALKTKMQQKKRAFLFLILLINLGILGAMKYVLPTVKPGIALPLGISFYTFQAIAYMVDVHGEKYEAQENPAKLLLYLCWFPQLIQGPINRYDQIREDLYKSTSLTMADARYAFYLFLFGAIKKYAIGDMVAPLVTRILGGNPADYPGAVLLFGAFLFAIEQYANFSGGIDMVMGISMLFGVKLADNFKQPYFSKTLAQFWRRWHISLGAFMRDYVFYPFATTKTIQKLTKNVSNKWGNHWGRSVTGGIGNLIVFALVGIWHGPQLHYLAWGLYNGVIIAASDTLAPFFESVKKKLGIASDSKWFGGFQMFRTFMIIVFAGYFDIVESVSYGLLCFKRTFLNFGAGGFSVCLADAIEDGSIDLRMTIVALLGCAILLTFSILRERKMDPIAMICERKIAARWTICYALLLLFLFSFTASGGVGGFMYAAF